MSRVPWKPPLRRAWFLSRPAYRRYAVRECTAMFIALIGVDLCVASLSLAVGPEALEGWWLVHQTPVGLSVAVLTAVMTGIHALTWLSILPSLVPPRRLWGALLRPGSTRPRPGHHEPLRWGLFGAGGSVAVLLLPLALAVPLLALVTPSNPLAAIESRAGRLSIAIVAPLLLWHGAHRVFHGLHDLQLGRGPLAWGATYGIAIVVTLMTWFALVWTVVP